MTHAPPTLSGLAIQAFEDARQGLFPGYISLVTDIILQHDCNPKFYCMATAITIHSINQVDCFI